MTRSLFFTFFLRLSVSMLLILVIRATVLPEGWVLPCLFVVGLASANAWMLVRSVHANLRPLQTTARHLARGGAAPDSHESRLARNLQHGHTDPRFSDFDALAVALRMAGHQVDSALTTAAGTRDELAAMIDSLQDPVIAVNRSSRIQWMNQHFQRVLPAGSGMGGARIGQAIVHVIRDPEILACVRVALDERLFCQRRTTLLLPGHILEVNASPMPSGGAVVLLRDVTRLEQIERAQREFVANVSHELRTPLTSITGYVETLIDHEGALSPQGRIFLGTILKNATRMNRLTEDLLTMARVESSDGELQPVPISAELLVRDAVQGVSGLIQESSATIEVQPIPECDVLADRDAAIQVLTNLIENATKYGRDRRTGHARVVVSARSIDHEDGARVVEFSVRDFGPGIGSEHLPRLFERFYRVDKARSLETGGTGLGLSIARHIVQSLGGEIRAESVLNAGSTFLFTLPVVQPPRAHADAEAEPAA